MIGKDYEGDEEFQVTCPACDQTQDEAVCFLGTLGHLTHYRCRFCGMTFNQDGGVR